MDEPSTSRKVSKTVAEQLEGTVCSFCEHTLFDGEIECFQIRALPCGHLFHKICLLDAVNRRGLGHCPICGFELIIDDSYKVSHKLPDIGLEIKIDLTLASPQPNRAAMVAMGNQYCELAQMLSDALEKLENSDNETVEQLEEDALANERILEETKVESARKIALLDQQIIELKKELEDTAAYRVFTSAVNSSLVQLDRSRRRRREPTASSNKERSRSPLARETTATPNPTDKNSKNNCK